MIRRIARAVLALVGLLGLLGIVGTVEAQQTAAGTLAGQRISTCKDDLRFTISVVSAEAREQIADHPASPGDGWVVVIADITNQGRRPDNAQFLANVQDDRGNVIEWTVFSDQDQYVDTDTAAEYRVTPSWQTIAPNRTVRTILFYLVPTSVRRLTLIANEIGCTAPPLPLATGTGAPTTGPSTSPPPPPPSGQDPLIGQRASACNYNADMSIVVLGVDRVRTIADGVAPSGYQWIVLTIQVTNTSNKAEALTSRPVLLRDASGTLYEVREDPPDITAVADMYGVTAPWLAFLPGVTDRSVLTYLVPTNAGTLTLVGRRDYCD